jgi:hypothetical protein
MEMKIWLVERKGFVDMGQYEAFVCRAHTAEEARFTHQDPDYQGSPDDEWGRWDGWISKDRLLSLEVTLIGISIVQHEALNSRVILASFNEG